jgi:hypothetical protein
MQNYMARTLGERKKENKTNCGRGSYSLLIDLGVQQPR